MKIPGWQFKGPFQFLPLLVLLAILGSGIAVILKLEDSLREQVRVQFEVDATASLATFEKTLADWTHQFQSFSDLPSFRTLHFHALSRNEIGQQIDIRHLELYALGIKHRQPELLGIRLINNSGAEAFKIDGGGISRNLSDLSLHPDVRMASQLGSGQLRVTLTHLPGTAKKLTWWVPVRISDSVGLGVLAFDVDFSTVERGLSLLARPGSSMATLEDVNGNVLAYAGPQSAQGVKANPAWSISRPLGLPGLQWQVRVLADSKALLQGVDTLHRTVVFGLLPLAMLLLAALGFQARRRIKSEEALQESEARLQSIFDASPDALLISDAKGVIVMANRQFENLLGYTPGEMLGRPIDDLVPLSFRGNHAHLRSKYAEDPTSRQMGQGLEVKALRKDGSECEVEVSLSVIRMDQGLFIASALRDVTERNKAQANLRIAAAAFDAQEGMIVTDANCVILRVNRAFCAITGYAAEEVVGQKTNMLKSGRHDADFYRSMWETINLTGGWQGEIWDRRKNGEEYLKWLTISAVKDEKGAVTHYVGTYVDITERKKAEDKINELAYFDPLTGLPNRILLLDRLRQVMTASARDGNYGALLFIDLDNFKTLNDTLGHDMGDQLLKQVAQRLKSCVREVDTVARLGGDEFVLVLGSLSPSKDDAALAAEMVAEKILATFNQPYLIGDVTHRSTASVGVTLFMGQTNSIDDLMKQADLAMYKSKETGRNRLRFFDPTMEAAVMQRVAMEGDLREAIQEKQFLLHYQPQVVDEGRLIGAEVLLRWPHPRRGMVSPAEFIPLAEESGLILPLGHWVLETACRQLAEWASRPEMAHLTVAVNVSAHQVGQDDFVDQVLAVLAATGANPQRLKLELTESLLVSNVETIIAKMTALKAQGVGFSLDDFGTGYSSLAYLKRLPLDQLKIDQSFVRDVLVDPNDAALAKTIVALAQSLGLDVIAEGVETEAQRDFLAASGCHAYQGYFFSRPLPIDGFEQYAQQR